MNTLVLAISDILSENTELVCQAIQLSMQLTPNQTQDVSITNVPPNLHAKIIQTHELCKAAIFNVAAMLQHIVALCNTEYADFVLKDIPELCIDNGEGAIVRQIHAMVDYALSPPGEYS